MATGETPFPKRPKGAWDDPDVDQPLPEPIAGLAEDVEVHVLLDLVQHDKQASAVGQAPPPPPTGYQTLRRPR